MMLAVINIGPLLMVGSLWLGVWLGWTSLASRWQVGANDKAWKSARRFLTGGLAALAAHTLITFDNYHNWSHEMARVAMELRVAEYLPIKSGAVIYVTYLYLALWAIEVVWSWAAFDLWQRRGRWLDGAIQFYLQLYGLVLVLWVGGVGAHYVPPWLPGLLTILAAGGVTWFWRQRMARH